MEKTDLTTGSLWVHLRRLAVPASVGFTFNVLFNITDTFCAGLWSTDAQAGLAFSFPLFFITLAISVGLLQASAGLLARSKGAGQARRAQYYFGQVTFLVVVCGLALGGISLAITKPVLTLLGSEAKQAEHAFGYLFWIFAFTPLMVASLVMSGVLSAYGNTTAHRNALVTTSLINLILDPMLMFGWFGLPRLGMDGIGIATVIAFALQIVIMAPALLRLPLFTEWKNIFFRPRLAGIKACLAMAWPPTASMLSICAGFFINTYFIASIDTIAVAAYGIALRIEQLVLLPSIGLTTALLAIAGQNFGAKHYLRTHEIFRIAINCGIVISIIGAIILVGGGLFLVGLFNDSDLVAKYGYEYCITGAILGPVYVYAHSSNSLLQALGKPKLMALHGIVRLIVLPLLLCPLFVYGLDMGTRGVWLALILSNVFPSAILFIYAKAMLHKLAPQPVAA